MVKPDIFAIVFDDLNRIYQPGQFVTGHIDLQLSKEMKTNGVYVTLFGGAETHWTEQEAQTYHDQLTNKRDTRYATMHYRGSEVYINVSMMLWGNGSARMMPPGRYSLPFSACLPQVCLPSFQGGKGRVYYCCRAKIDRPWSFDHKVKEMFTVLPVYDLNLNPVSAIGMSAEDSKSLGYCCCAAGTVFFKLDISKSGFVPGECIKAIVSIDNQSSRPMEAVEINLLQATCYSAVRQAGGRHNKKTETRTISTVVERLQEVEASSKYSLTKDIRIPAVVATMGNNSIIQVQYVLECKLVPTGLSISSRVLLPIVVGTVPLRHPPTTALLGKGNPSLAFSSIPSAPVELLAAFSAPPTYEECMFGKMDARDDEDNEYTGGNLAYAPKYLVYHF